MRGLRYQFSKSTAPTMTRSTKTTIRTFFTVLLLSRPRLWPSLRDVAQRAKARHKKISAPAHRYELWYSGEAACQLPVSRYGEVARNRAISRRSTISEKWIVLVRHAIEFRAHNPRVLYEFELSADVCAHAGEMQAARGIASGSGFEGLFRREGRTVLTAAPQETMKSGRGDEVGAHLGARKSQAAEPSGNQTGWMPEQIGIARIGAADVRPKRASRAGWVGVIKQIVHRGICSRCHQW